MSQIGLENVIKINNMGQLIALTAIVGMSYVLAKFIVDVISGKYRS